MAQINALRHQPSRIRIPEQRVSVKAQVVHADSFVSASRAQAAAVPSTFAAEVDSAFQANLGRPPTQEELTSFSNFAAALTAQGKGPAVIEAAFRWVVCAGPEWQARSVCQAELKREPTPDELVRAVAWGKELQAQGRSTGEMRDAFVFVTRMGPEWQARSVIESELHRSPTPDELAKGRAFGESLVAQGKTTAEVHDAFVYVTRMGAEWQDAHRPDAVRSQIAQWAIDQANDPSVGFGQTPGRFGERMDANGRRYFDCSGLVTAAYAQAGIHLPANWTGAMRSTWPQWADQVPKNTSQMQPGDLILMDGHVVMYTGNGRCVGAQTSHTAFADQVTANIDANRYLARADAIVIRPHGG